MMPAAWSAGTSIASIGGGSAGHPFVDLRFDTTVIMVPTIEALLGLPASSRIHFDD
jgi:hypothetical protein